VRRLVLAALRARRGPTALLFLLAVLAVAAGSGAPLYADSAVGEVQAAQYASAVGADRAISAAGPVLGGGDASHVTALRDRLVEATKGRGLTPLTTMEVSGVTEGAGEPNRVVLATRDDVCAHLVVRGNCPTSAGQAVVAEGIAGLLGVRPGSPLVVRAPAAPLRIRLTVVGLYRPVDGTEPYWAGRSDFTGDARSQATPVFVDPATVVAARPESVQARIDLVALDPHRLPNRPDELSQAVDDARLAAPSGVSVTSGLPDLIRRVGFERQLLTTGIAIGASQLVVLCCLVLLLAAAAAAADRRAESALATLRGAPRRHWAALAVGPTAAALLAAAAVGYGAGWLGAWAARRWMFDDPQPPVPTRASLIIAAATVAVVLVAAVGAEWTAHRGGLLDNLRRTPPRRRRWRVSPTDLIALVLAGAAGYQALAGDTTGGLAVAAPLLLALACGLFAARLVLPVAARVGVALLHRGRLAGGLAALDLARRPHAQHLLVVVTVAVALLGLATSGADTTRRAVADRAALELGADRVLTVASGPAATRAAVHAADPRGRWAMAAVRVRVGARTLVAVEADRLPAVASWPAGAPDVDRLAAALRPSVNRPVTVYGGEVTLDASVTSRLAIPARLTLRLFEPDGTARDAVVDLGPAPGRRAYRVAVPGCASGCRLAWFSFPSSPEHIRLHGLRQRDNDGEREVLAPRDFGAPGRWRPGFTASPGELALEHGDGWLSATYRPIDLRFIASELHLRLADSPVPLPVAAAGPRGPGTLSLWTMSSTLRPVEVVDTARGLPGGVGDGFLFDHEYAERLGGEPGTPGGGEVWLAADVPADVVARLRAALPVTGDETAAARSARLLGQGAGQSVRLHALAGLLGLALAGGAVLTVAAAERRRRARELGALRVQGLPARAAARAALLGYTALVTGGLAAGLVAAVVDWAAAHRLMPVFGAEWVATTPPVLPRALVAAAALVVAAVALLGCARFAARRLARADGGAQRTTTGETA
jgi:hypothetical protein